MWKQTYGENQEESSSSSCSSTSSSTSTSKSLVGCGRVRLAAVNEYMAGAFFVLTPDPQAFKPCSGRWGGMGADGRFGYNGNGGGGYAYGEQDFFNDFWRGAGAAGWCR